MNLTGQRVLFRLSAKGYESLSGILPPSGPCYVVEENTLGLWIAPQDVKVTERVPVRVTLLKWDHVATVEFVHKPTTALLGSAGDQSDLLNRG